MDTELNEQIGKTLDIIVDKNQKNRVFTAFSIGFVEQNKSSFNTAVFNYGQSGTVLESKPVDNSTLYDLASLTKPLVT